MKRMFNNPNNRYIKLITIMSVIVFILSDLSYGIQNTLRVPITSSAANPESEGLKKRLVSVLGQAYPYENFIRDIKHQSMPLNDDFLSSSALRDLFNYQDKDDKREWSTYRFFYGNPHNPYRDYFIHENFSNNNLFFKEAMKRLEHPFTNLKPIRTSYSAISSLLAIPDEKIQKLSEHVLDYYKELYKYNCISKVYNKREITAHGHYSSYELRNEGFPDMLICLDKMLKDLSAICEILQEGGYSEFGYLSKKKDKIILNKNFIQVKKYLDENYVSIYENRSRSFNRFSDDLLAKFELEESYHLFNMLPLQLEGLLGELEFYLGGAKMAREGRYSIPDPTEGSGIIQLKSAWNPVAGKYEDMDKIDIDVGVETNFFGVTGPNEIGKSTTIEMIALCVLYFQMGLPIPAEAGTIGVFKNIYTVTPDIESVEPGESHHTGLIKRLMDLIDKVGPRDMVIIDEAHMGSEFKDLSALTTVLMEDLVKKGATVLYATHLRNAMELLAVRIPNAQPYKLEYEIDKLKQKSARVLTPGITKGSFSSYTLKRAGFPEPVIKWTEEYYNAIIDGKEVEVLTEFPEEIFSRSAATGDIGYEMRTHNDAQDRKIFCKARDVLFPLKNFYYDYAKAEELWNNDNPYETQEDFKKWENVDIGILRKFRNVLFDDIDIGKFSWPDIKPEVLKVKTRENKGKILYFNYEKDKALICYEELKRVNKLVMDNLENKRRVLIKIDNLVNFNCEGLIIKLTEEIERREMLFQANEFEKGADEEELKKELSAKRQEIAREYRKFLDELGNYGLIKIDFFTGVVVSMAENNLNFWKNADREESFILHNGRSPFVPGAVPISLKGDTEYPVFVITGPNKSGKTSVVRTLQVVYSLKRRGLPIPADPGSRIPEYDNMLTFFGGGEDSSKGESYFRSVAERLMYILKNASSGSLIIMDELHGSDYWELSALQAALIRYLNKIDATVVLNTHMREGLIAAGKTISCKFLKTDVEVASDGKIIYNYSISEDRNLEAKSLGIETVREHLKTEERYQRALELREFFSSQAPARKSI